MQACRICYWNTATSRFIVDLPFQKGRSVALTFLVLCLICMWRRLTFPVSFPSEILRPLLAEVKNLKSTLQVRCALKRLFVFTCVYSIYCPYILDSIFLYHMLGCVLSRSEWWATVGETTPMNSNHSVLATTAWPGLSHRPAHHFISLFLYENWPQAPQLSQKNFTDPSREIALEGRCILYLCAVYTPIFFF